MMDRRNFPENHAAAHSALASQHPPLHGRQRHCRYRAAIPNFSTLVATRSARRAWSIHESAGPTVLAPTKPRRKQLPTGTLEGLLR